MKHVFVEAVGWFSTLVFLVSIIMPNRFHLHVMGVIAAVTTGYYAYEHGATAIWVKWLIALFFHAQMLFKLRARASDPEQLPKGPA